VTIDFFHGTGAGTLDRWQRTCPARTGGTVSSSDGSVCGIEADCRSPVVLRAGRTPDLSRILHV